MASLFSNIYDPENPLANSGSVMANSSQYNGVNPYDINADAATNSKNILKAQNDKYADFMKSLPQFQTDMTNQALDQGAQGYNQEKSTIDKSANRRGLLYSGLKQGAEQGAASQMAGKTSGAIAKGNAALTDYANQYGTQVSQSNAAGYQNQVNTAMENYKNQMANYDQQQQGTGQLMQGIGTAASLAALIKSDKNLKNNVKSGDKASQEMIDKLDSKTFSYKDDPDDKEQLGIIAQDLEKSPMGKAIVVETPKGKHIDIGKALSAVLAVQSVMNKRLNKAGA